MADRARAELQLTPAKRLNEVYRTVENRPLMTRDELDKLYETEINAARGDDAMSHLQRALVRQHRSVFFKRFFYGSRGSGKSTEMSRLLQSVSTLYRGVRVGVTDELNPASFEPHEVILAIALCLARDMQRVVEETQAQKDIAAETLWAIQEWFV